MTFSPGEVGHVHHDHAHVLGQYDDVIGRLVPFGDLHVQEVLLLLELQYIFLDRLLFLLR